MGGGACGLRHLEEHGGVPPRIVEKNIGRPLEKAFHLPAGKGGKWVLYIFPYY